jgi:transposase, IS5 family
VPISCTAVFARIGTEKVPDAKTLGRLCREIDRGVIGEPHVELARQEKIVRGDKLRVDTTVVETNVHYSTDNSLLNDGTRVLTRTMKRMEAKKGKAQPKGAGPHAERAETCSAHRTGEPAERTTGRAGEKEALSSTAVGQPPSRQ